jgi:hypothetical protein
MSLKNPVTPPGINPGTVRVVAQRLNHYAKPRPRVVSHMFHNNEGLLQGVTGYTECYCMNKATLKYTL